MLRVGSILGRIAMAGFVTVMIFQLVACGTLFYPERIGQRGGQVDPAVIILDGIGLLCFFIPGVIAFVVDFANGTIYLPPGGKSRIFEKTGSGLDVIKVPLAELTLDRIKEIIHTRTGYEMDFSSPALKIYSLRYGEMDNVAELLLDRQDTFFTLSGITRPEAFASSKIQ